MGKNPDGHDMELTGFLEWVMHETAFQKWFFGHWHIDKELRGGFRALYCDVVPIDQSGERGPACEKER